MSIKDICINFHIEENYILTEVKGHLQYQDIENIFRQIIQSDEFTENLVRVYDVSAADLSSVDFQVLEKIIKFTEQFLNQRPESKVAFISSRPINQPILELYRVFSAKKNKEIGVFSSFKEAKKWFLPEHQ